MPQSSESIDDVQAPARGTGAMVKGTPLIDILPDAGRIVCRICARLRKQNLEKVLYLDKSSPPAKENGSRAVNLAAFSLQQNPCNSFTSPNQIDNESCSPILKYAVSAAISSPDYS